MNIILEVIKEFIYILWYTSPFVGLEIEEAEEKMKR